jgi:hypothetical protein
MDRGSIGIDINGYRGTLVHTGGTISLGRRYLTMRFAEGDNNCRVTFSAEVVQSLIDFVLNNLPHDFMLSEFYGTQEWKRYLTELRAATPPGVDISKVMTEEVL